MEIKKILLAPFICLGLMFGACSDENQSSLDIESVEGTAVVEGRISYNRGYVWNGTEYSADEFAAAAGKNVYFYLDVASFNGGEEDDYSGALVYETTTGADGSFTIELPANTKGIDYTVFVEGFKAQRNLPDGYDSNGNAIYKEKDFYFTGNEADEFTLYQNVNTFRSIKLDSDSYTEID